MRLRVVVLAEFAFLACMAGQLSAASKPHVITFGRWTPIKLLAGPNEDQTLEIKMRPLYVDALVKAYTFGLPHEVTDRLLVVQRMVRLNDNLPSELTGQHWIWQRGGWLMIDRVNGHTSPVNLAEFDPEYSAANWYRDYVAYCGISQDARRIYAVVMQLGKRKPILKKPIAETKDDAAMLECMPPTWERQPTRVTFAWKPDQKITYAVRGSAIEINEDDEQGTE
jgi:hypothetical protein